MDCLNIALCSHIGNSRTNQEDSSIIIVGKNNASNPISLQYVFNEDKAHCNQSRSDKSIIIVSDGMGGHSSGEVASYLTVKYFADNYFRIIDLSRTELVAEIANLSRSVLKAAQENVSYKGMGATLCGLIVKGDEVLGFNVGDSRVYKYFSGNLVQLSKDHTEGQRLLDLGLLTDEELKTFPNRKSIYKYIGMKTELVADIFEIERCEKGAILMLCTDGLSDVLSDFEIQTILNNDEPLKLKGENLLNNALERNAGHGDNITIILIEF